MLDELREQAGDSYLDDNEDEEEGAPAYFRMRYESDAPFLGMTPAQRFVLALMLLLMIGVLGVSLLLITGTVIPPF